MVDVVVPQSGRRLSLGGTAARAALLNIGRGLVALLASVIITRALGPAGRGLFSFVTNAIGVLVLLSTAGSPAALTRAKAKLGASVGQLYGAALLMAGLFGGSASAAFLVLYAITRGSLFVGVTSHEAILVIALVPLVLLTGLWGGVAYLEGRVLQVGYYAFLSVLALLGVAVPLALAGRLTPTTIVVAWSATNLIPLVLLARRAFNRATKPGYVLVRTLVIYSLRTNVASLALVLVWRLDVFMVKGFRGYQELGSYAVAVSIGEILLQVAISLRVALVPLQGSEENRRKLQNAIELSTRVTLWVGGLGAFALAAASRPLVELLYGATFATAAGAVALIVPGIVFVIAQGPLIDFLLVEGKVRQVTFAAVVSLGINVVMNVALLPHHTYIVASLSSTVSYLIGFMLCARAYNSLTRAGISSLVVVRRADFAMMAGRR